MGPSLRPLSSLHYSRHCRPAAVLSCQKIPPEAPRTKQSHPRVEKQDTASFFPFFKECHPTGHWRQSSFPRQSTYLSSPACGPTTFQVIPWNWTFLTNQQLSGTLHKGSLATYMFSDSPLVVHEAPISHEGCPKPPGHLQQSGITSLRSYNRPCHPSFRAPLLPTWFSILYIYIFGGA